MNRDERIVAVMGALSQAWHLTSPSNECATVMLRQAVIAVDKEWTDPPRSPRPAIDSHRLDVLQAVLDEWLTDRTARFDFARDGINTLRDAKRLHEEQSLLIEELRK